MKFFSYAMAYAVIVFLIYMVIKFFRFSYVRIKAYMISRKLSKASESEKKDDTEKKDD